MIKTAFVTCVQIGLSCIEEIYNIGGKIDLLITLKDQKGKDKSGRIYLDKIASMNSIPLLKINNINDNEVINTLVTYDIDWLFIIGWSQIAKNELLNTPKKGCIGMHPTLLPVGRGRAAIPWAIIKGLDKTGVTMFKLNEGVDTGDIIAQGEIKLNKDITATELYDKVNTMHTQLIRDNWINIISDNIKLIKQNEKLATEWPGRHPEDGELTEDMTMEEAHTLVRATTHPYPGAFVIRKNSKVVIWSASKNKDEGDIKFRNGYLQLIDYEVLEYED
jgi:methionyl-tRNA formyltransferase